MFEGCFECVFVEDVVEVECCCEYGFFVFYGDGDGLVSG